MKKSDPLVVIMLLVLFVGVAFLLGCLIGIWTGSDVFNNVFVFIFVFMALLLYLPLSTVTMMPFAKKTMDKNLKDQNFTKPLKYINTNSFTLGYVLCVDEETGRVAYVSALNPFKFQMVHAGELTKIRSSYAKGPFGGTRYVFFEFYIGNTRMRFPTLATRSMWSVASRSVQNAIATGDEFVRVLTKFQPSEKIMQDQKNARFNKKGIIGFILANISIIVTLITIASLISASGTKDTVVTILAYSLSGTDLALVVTAFVLGLVAVKSADNTLIRGMGFSKTAVAMSASVSAVLILSFTIFVLGSR